ncbi:MAG: hypothetical protein ABSE21_02525 [Bryobacteraceae bacterium]
MGQTKPPKWAKCTCQTHVVYLLWIFVVVLLFPVCLWYARLKERRKDWWLSYV